MHVAGRDGISGLNDFPLLILFGHGALNYGAIGAPFEAAKAPRSAQSVEMTAAFGSGGTGSDKRGFVANRAVAIDAVDFDGGARLTVNFAVAVIVLRKMAVVALHSFFQMDVSEMDGFAEAVGIIERDLLAVFVEPVPFPVVIEDGPEDPAVAVEIGELRGFQFRVEFRAAEIFEKFFIAPEAAGGGGFWIAQIGLVALLFGRIALLRRIHFVAVDFVVPPSETEIRREHVRAGMDVADHALARRNGAREDVLDGMAGLILGNSRIGRSAETGVAELRIGCRVRRIAIVCVNDVAGGAAAGAIVAGMIVGAGQRHHRIDETRFLQAEKDGIGAEFRAETAVAQFGVWLAGIFFAIGIA